MVFRRFPRRTDSRTQSLTDRQTNRNAVCLRHRLSTASNA